MIFALLTLLSALSLASVAGWFSIIGITSIYAGAPLHALIMGIVLECGKLVTTSWLYRNWSYSDWRLKLPLVVFTVALMMATSIGVYGFLSKSHLEQGAGTIDNSAKVERLDQQIAKEKSIIADNEKVIAQLDATINSYLGKDRTDRSVTIRKSQAPQRKQLREEIDASQKRIDVFSEEKFKLQSEVRKLQLEVGPIRYIAELIYGVDNNTDKNIEAAIRMFTLLIVSILDPLALVLLIAANHTIMQRQNEKKKEISTPKENTRGPVDVAIVTETKESVLPATSSMDMEFLDETPQVISEKVNKSETLPLSTAGCVEETTEIIRNVSENRTTSNSETKETGTTSKVQEINNEEKETEVVKIGGDRSDSSFSFVRSPTPSRLAIPEFNKAQEKIPKQKSWEDEDAVFRELRGYSVDHQPHFVPMKINEENLVSTDQSNLVSSKKNAVKHKYPKALSWLTEFTRT